MNTIRITAIPIAHAMLGLDLSHGVLHDLLGYCTMGLAISLMISSDELLLKLRKYLPNWLRSLGSEPLGSEPLATIKSTNISQVSGWPRAVLLAPALLLFAFCFGIQAYDVSESWGQQRDVIISFAMNR
ncbi:MAG: hypothetical protein R3C09_03720 [Pirellulaceae bacterium]